RMSNRSHSWRTVSARRRTSASEEKSARKKAAEPRLAARISLSNCSPRVRSRPWIRTRAPPSASRRATSRPTPSVDPVTSTVLFSMFMLPTTAKIWFGFGHEGLSILLHPGTGDDYADHTDHAVWLGSALRLRVNVLRKSRKTPAAL